MADYRAKPGMEDRHGEMTGAISINMMLSMLPVTIWAFLFPLFVDNIYLWIGSTVLLALILPFAMLPLSRRIWALISTYMDSPPRH